MNTVILTDEQEQFLLGILSHDSDVVASLVAESEEMEDVDIEGVRDLMSTTFNALIGKNDGQVAAFHGTRETGCDYMTISTDISLSDGLAVLTATHNVAPVADPTWEGFLDGGDGKTAKYVQVPQAQGLAGYLAACIEIAMDDPDTLLPMIGGTDISDHEEEVDLINSFVAALRRTVPKEEEQRGEILVHLNLAISPSDKRSADEIGTAVMAALAGKPYSEIEGDEDVQVAGATITNVLSEEV